jgi:hypothetical protein
MIDINIGEGRALLQTTLKDVREVLTSTRVKEERIYRIKTETGMKLFEFIGPGGFWWSGRADNAYEARAKGWDAWLTARGFR